MQTEASHFPALGPVYERKVLGQRLLMVGGATAAREVFVEGPWARAILGPIEALRTYLPTGMFTVRTKDPLWSAAREVLAPAFTRAAMSNYHSTMIAVADDLVSRWESNAGTESVDDDMTRFTIEVISRCGMGSPLGTFDLESVDDHPVVDSLRGLLRWSSDEANTLPLISAPERWLARREADKHAKTLYAYAQRCADDHRRTSTTTLLDHLLDARTSLPDDNIHEQLITFLVAGHETTAATLSAALFHIAQDPDLQRRIRGEVRSVIGSDRTYQFGDVARMRLTSACIREALRLWPAVPAVFRVAREPSSINGFPVPRGTTAMAVLLAAQRDPDEWGPTADVYDPDRWKPHTTAFFQPFGTGPRSCIGRQFALHESTIALAKLIERFDITLTENAAPAPEIIERGSIRVQDFKLVASAEVAR